MKAKPFLLPGLALASAASLFLPVLPSRAFAKNGGSLDETQRDVRVFDNFADASANDNLTPSPQFPGRTGAELAVWKAVVEWGSILHGDGTGDPLAANLLGSGGANFDGLWAGSASEIGGIDDNIASAISTCGGGSTLSYIEVPISDGWRIRYCDDFTWDDGPGQVSGFDIQSSTAFEYGFALGLSYSTVNGATMQDGFSPGDEDRRSLQADDRAGVQCIYGVASATKPTLVATVANAGVLTIHGANFDATDNEVWFTNAAATAGATDPIVKVTSVASSSGGTIVAVTIPPAAGPGDVIVKKPGTGGATLSNAFPTDLVGTFSPAVRPAIASVTPSAIEALIPGTGHTITIGGTHLDLTASLLLDGASITPSRWTIVSAAAITLDMPQASSLGAHTLGASDGFQTSNFVVTIVAPSNPTFQMGTGDPLDVVDRDDGLSMILSGIPGEVHRLLGSPSGVPSVNAYVALSIGNNFTQLVKGGDYVIPASGWLKLFLPPGALFDPGPGGFTLYAQTVRLGSTPFLDGNVQSMLLVQ